MRKLNLPIVNVVQDSLQVPSLDSLQAEERVGMFVLSEAEDPPEVAAAGTQNQLVGGDLHQVLTDQAHVQQLLLSSQRAEGFGEIRLKVIPFQIKAFRAHVDVVSRKVLLKLVARYQQYPN